MRRFAILAAMVACTLTAASATSCNTADVSTKVTSVDTSVQSKLTEYCPKFEAAHTAYKLATFFVTVPPKVSAVVDAAYAAGEIFCADPSSVSVASAPAKVLDAIDKISQAKADATSS